MPLSYKKNKQYIYNWREKNKQAHSEGVSRCYYKKKLSTQVSKEYAEIVFIFFDILRERD